MKTCLFCRNTRIFNIHNDYGNSSHTAKDDMLQFFGYQVSKRKLKVEKTMYRFYTLKVMIVNVMTKYRFPVSW
jgi:hypothetical protein